VFMMNHTDDLRRTETNEFRIKALRWQTQYDYNLAGQVTNVEYPDGFNLSYDYDNAGLPTRVRDPITHKPYAAFSTQRVKPRH